MEKNVKNIFTFKSTYDTIWKNMELENSERRGYVSKN